MSQPLVPTLSNTTRHTIDPRSPDPARLDRAAELLRAGRLVVAPTETRYGLLGRSGDEAAVRRLCAAKGREFHHPVAVFVRSVTDLSVYAELTPAAKLLAERFLPGPLTLVLASLANWPAPLVVSGKTGYRVSPSPVIAGLLERVGEPLTATSANLSGQPEAAEVGEIEAQLGDTISLYLDGGRLEGAVSSVVDGTTTPPRLLREGALSHEKLAAVDRWRPVGNIHAASGAVSWARSHPGRREEACARHDLATRMFVQQGWHDN